MYLYYNVFRCVGLFLILFLLSVTALHAGITGSYDNDGAGPSASDAAAGGGAGQNSSAGPSGGTGGSSNNEGSGGGSFGSGANQGGGNNTIGGGNTNGGSFSGPTDTETQTEGLFNKIETSTSNLLHSVWDSFKNLTKPIVSVVQNVTGIGNVERPTYTDFGSFTENTTANLNDRDPADLNGPAGNVSSETNYSYGELVDTDDTSAQPVPGYATEGTPQIVTVREPIDIPTREDLRFEVQVTDAAGNITQPYTPGDVVIFNGEQLSFRWDCDTCEKTFANIPQNGFAPGFNMGEIVGDTNASGVDVVEGGTVYSVEGVDAYGNKIAAAIGVKVVDADGNIMRQPAVTPAEVEALKTAIIKTENVYREYVYPDSITPTQPYRTDIEYSLGDVVEEGPYGNASVADYAISPGVINSTEKITALLGGDFPVVTRERVQPYDDVSVDTGPNSGVYATYTPLDLSGLNYEEGIYELQQEAAKSAGEVSGIFVQPRNTAGYWIVDRATGGLNTITYPDNVASQMHPDHLSSETRLTWVHTHPDLDNKVQNIPPSFLDVMSATDIAKSATLFGGAQIESVVVESDKTWTITVDEVQINEDSFLDPVKKYMSAVNTISQSLNELPQDDPQRTAAEAIVAQGLVIDDPEMQRIVESVSFEESYYACGYSGGCEGISSEDVEASRQEILDIYERLGITVTSNENDPQPPEDATGIDIATPAHTDTDEEFLEALNAPTLDNTGFLRSLWNGLKNLLSFGSA